MKAGGAHSSRIERIPSVAAVTRPHVILARCPSAEWASYAGAGGLKALVLIWSRSITTDDLEASFNIAADSCLRIACPDNAVLPVSALKISSA